jgi:Immunity protein 26
MPSKKHPKIELGSIVAVPLPDGRFAYARAFADDTFGVLDVLSDRLLTEAELMGRSVAFYRAANLDNPVKSGQWPLVGRLPFAHKEDAYPPPVATCYVWDSNEWTMGGVPRIEHRGVSRPATLDEVRGLDYLSVSPPAHFVAVIVDRLINGNHYKYQVRAE